MKNFLYIFLVSSLFIFSCDKEEVSENQKRDFIKFYTNYPEFSAADVVVTDNGYAILGTAKTLEGGTWISLLRTDNLGNSIDSARIYGISGDDGPANIAYCLKALDDGGFGILGSVLNNQTGYRSAYFIRTDANGDTLFTRMISLNGDLVARYFDVSSQGSFYMTGYFDLPGKGHQIWWFGIDDQGNGIRNQRIFGYDYADEGNHLTILPDGRLLIAGFITLADTARAVLIKTDENTIYVNHYESKPVADETGNFVLPLSDIEYLLLSTSGDNSSSSLKLENIQWNNPKPAAAWTRVYNSNDIEFGRRLINDDQSIYILGTTSFSPSNSVISLIRTNLSGEEQSRMEFGSGSKLSAAAFERTNDGGFIITGTNINPEANNTSVALIKIR
ncbi:MAG TPA: hypothetical protein VHI78_02250 [Bacteroidales bacterium]|jgi:hypothetical protein|nr:hypothetical protein [Bacteroidales bacterium]